MLGFVRATVASSVGHYVRATKLMRRLPEALRLLEKLNDEAAGKGSSATEAASGIRHLESSVLSDAAERDVLLSIEAAAAHSQGRKHNANFNAPAFYLWTSLFLQELKTRQSTA